MEDLSLLLNAFRTLQAKDHDSIPGTYNAGHQAGAPASASAMAEVSVMSVSPRRMADGPGGEPRFHYLVRWRDSRRIEHARMFSTEGEAAGFDSDVKAGRLEPGGQTRRRLSPAFEAEAMDWLATKQATKRARTAARYESHLRLHVLPAFGPVPVVAITRHDVQAWINTLAQGEPRSLDDRGHLPRRIQGRPQQGDPGRSAGRLALPPHRAAAADGGGGRAPDAGAGPRGDRRAAAALQGDGSDSRRGRSADLRDRGDHDQPSAR
jgi:hypothetical protein